MIVSAQDINTAHDKAQGSAKTAIEYAVECGRLLAAKKAELKHGEFMPWVGKNCDFDQRTANAYMKGASQIGNALPISTNIRKLFGVTPESARKKSKPPSPAGAQSSADDPKDKPKPEAKDLPANPDGDGDLLGELERADKQIRALQYQNDSLQKTDLAKELASWQKKYGQLEGRLHQEMASHKEAVRQAMYSTGLLAKIRKALKVEKNSQILPALAK